MARLYPCPRPGAAIPAVPVADAAASTQACTGVATLAGAAGGATPLRTQAHPARVDGKATARGPGRPHTAGPTSPARGGRRDPKAPYGGHLAPSPRQLAAVELALSRESDRLLAYLERHLPQELRPTIEPADVLQDTYFDAFRRIGEFRWEDADCVYRWLVTIARNRVIDLVRMKRALKRGGGGAAGRDVLADGNEDSVVGMLAELAVYRRTPSRSAAARELVVAVERSVGRLPETYAEVLRLRYLEGLPIEETARRMDRSPGAIKQLCNRAYQALRVEMKSASMYL